MSSLDSIEGIGPAYAAKRQSAGIGSLAALLKQGADKKGRTQIATDTGLTEKQILQWVNRADLARIKGIGGQYADLLKFSGVDTVPELAQRNAENLTIKMQEINTEKKLVRQVPSQSMVEDWVTQAKNLDRVITH